MSPSPPGPLVRMALAGLFALAAAACGRPAATPGDTPMVIASAYPVFFFAQQIGTGHADVRNLTPAGTEPHDYDPTARDITLIDRARMLVLNGGGFEAWGDKVRANLDARHTIVVVAGEDLFTREVVEKGANRIDPHVWLSPILAQRMVDKIAAGFGRIDPANAASYDANARALKSKLGEMDAAFRQGLAHCASRDITTSHAAFGYLADAYHLNQVPIAGLAPDAEPSPRQLADIAQFARAHHVTAIFFERLASPKLSQTLAAEVGARTMVLDPIEGLTKDDLAAGEDYFTTMRQNLTNLETALQCTP